MPRKKKILTEAELEEKKRKKRLQMREYYWNVIKPKRKKPKPPKNYSWDERRQEYKVYVGVRGKDVHWCYCKTIKDAKREAAFARKYHQVKDRGPTNPKRMD